MREKLEVPVEKLRRVCDAKSFSLRDTSKSKPASGFIGQPRATQALEFGLKMHGPGYHIFVVGPASGGKKRSVICEFLEKFAAERAAAAPPDLRDVCFLHNFANPEMPKAAFLPAGSGKKLKNQMEDMFVFLSREIPALFQSGGKCFKFRTDAEREFKQKLQKSQDDIVRKAQTKGTTVLPTPDGDLMAGMNMTNEAYLMLPEERQKEINAIIKSIEAELDEHLEKMMSLKRGYDERMDDFAQEALKELLESALKDARREYAGSPSVVNYLDELAEFILGHINLFNPNKPSEDGESPADVALVFMVNLFVDNSGRKMAPVVFEDNPTFVNLFGKVEKNFIDGAYVTDHTLLRPGSLVMANGGYLVLNAWDALRNLGVWEKLEKTLIQGELEIEDSLAFFGASSNIDPQPVPLNLKVIVLGDPKIYRLLAEYDPDFAKVFKVKAELDSEIPFSEENLLSYAGFIADCCKRENFPAFDASAVARIAEQGIRLANHQNKLSTRFDEIYDLAAESVHWASEAKSRRVTAEHVKKALAQQALRNNLLQQKIFELAQDGALQIDTGGKKKGQINGLFVNDAGDYEFGAPVRITARTFLGKQGLVSIQRKVKMSGSIYGIGEETLKGYFGEKYGRFKTFSFSASICFEQCYVEIEGNSASAAELICLISSLSELPLKQSLAITGAFDQFGDIQPIGGVNEKIEGFFDLCKLKGLTGEHGVVIPHQNVQNLMLKEEVVEACREGKFHVYAIRTINEGLELFMGESAENVIHPRVREYIRDKEKPAPNKSYK